MTDKHSRNMEGKEQQCHRASCGMHEPGLAQGETEDVGEETQVRTAVRWSQVDQREAGSSLASLAPRRGAEEEAESIRRDKNKLDEHVRPTPWSEEAMAADQLWIDKISEQQAVDIGQERLAVVVDIGQGRLAAAVDIGQGLLAAAVNIGQGRLAVAVHAFEEEDGEKSAHRYRIHLDGIEDHAQQVQCSASSRVLCSSLKLG
jgi:hypothetical protein